uniref:Uncharacterized protein n=1 Tax=Setaria italica TaxID=4555 RepID=K4A3W5_SETIT
MRGDAAAACCSCSRGSCVARRSLGISGLQLQYLLVYILGHAAGDA